MVGNPRCSRDPDRNHGSLSELVRLRPGDHIGWVFAGDQEFAELAKPFLAEGASRGERLLYVAADPDPEPLTDLASALDPQTLQITSIAEVYGASGIVDADSQRAVFATALAEAKGAGYTGIRVAADNTPLVTDPDRLAAWIRWETVADRFMSENPVTGLCAFDREKADIGQLRHLATLHPLSTARDAIPQYRMYYSNRFLWIEGEIDPFALRQVRAAILQSPVKRVIVDLAETRLATVETMSHLRAFCDEGVEVVIRGATEQLRNAAEWALMPAGILAWVD